MKILANKLKKGDTVSVVAPSSGIAPFAMHRINQTRINLEKLGLKVKFETHSLKNNGYVSATPKERAQDIHNAFLDKEVKIVMCLIGGNHSNQILKYIDWEIIKNNPKIFIGYSDITVLHHAIFKKTDLITFYGPCAMVEFGEQNLDKFTLNYFKQTFFDGEIGEIEASGEWTDEFMDWFQQKDLERDRIYLKNKGYEWWREGKVEADFLGGCIPSINHLAGTEYWNDLSNKVLFIDLPEGNEAGEPFSFSDLDSYLSDLDNLNVLKRLKGMVIGRPYGYKDYETDKLILKEIIMKHVEDYDYPVLFGVDIGHTAPMVTVPMNCIVELNSITNTFLLRGEFIN